jgi:hypothetical protein
MKPNKNGRVYPRNAWIKNLHKVQIGHIVPEGLPELPTMEWLFFEREAQDLSVEERTLLFRMAWEWEIKAHPDRDYDKKEKTRIPVSTVGIRGIVQRKCYYDLEDFKKLYKYVTRHRQCKTGLMRKGELCGTEYMEGYD